MSEHESKVNMHPVYDQIHQAESALKAIKGKDGISKSDLDVILRIEFVIENFQQALINTDRLLISIAWLDATNNSITQIIRSLQQWQNQPHNRHQHLANAENQLSIVLENTAKMNMVKSKNNLSGIMSSIKKYQETISKYLDSIEKRNQQLKVKEDDFSNRIEELTDTLTRTFSGLSESVTREQARLDPLVTKFNDQMVNNQNDFLNQQSGFDKQISEMQKQAETQFDEQRQDFKEQVDNALQEITSELIKFGEESKPLLVAFSERAETVIAENKASFDARHEEVKNIVGILNTNMFSHKYKEVADDARKRAKFWHRATILFIIGLTAFAIYSFGILLGPETTWVQLIARIFTATTMATAAAYSARQASKQEKVERYARKIEMEMVSIDSFLESLSTEQQREVKQEIARSIFGKSDSLGISDKEDSDSVILNKLFGPEDVIKLINKFK